MKNNNKTQWWSKKYGFFGSFYMEGDNSKEGYLERKKQTLKQRTLAEVNGVIKLLSLLIGAKILDCPCGYGRHGTELAKKGFKVLGSDINSIHLREAKKEMRKNNVEVKFVREDMRKIKYRNNFDAVINMFYSFGFFGSDKENEKVLKNFYNSLKSGGKFLMHTDVNVPRVIAGKYKEKEIRKLENGKTLRVIDRYDPATKRIYGCWIIKDKLGVEKMRNYSVRVYTKQEFINLCRKVGFRTHKVYSDWNGKPYSKNSEDMIIVATK